MKILAIGDIFGKIGRKVIKNCLGEIKQEYQIDLTIANVENATHGKGISFKHYQELEKSGIDVMTSGNHVFDLEETRKDIKKFSKLVRPLNSNPHHGGKGSIVVECKNKKIRITNLIGQVKMPPPLAQHPYTALKEILKKDDSDIHLVDFHAETTAEKIAFALRFTGEITALWGTHTHVQTADERILLKKTAFLSDVGMTGPSEGVIGVRPDEVIWKSEYGFPSPIYPCEKGPGQFNGLVLEIDDTSNKVISLQRIIKEIKV